MEIFFPFCKGYISILLNYSLHKYTITTSAVTEFRQVKFYLPGSEARKYKASSPLSLTKEDCRDRETIQQFSGARLENDTWRKDQGQRGLYR